MSNVLEKCYWKGWKEINFKLAKNKSWAKKNVLRKIGYKIQRKENILKAFVKHLYKSKVSFDIDDVQKNYWLGLEKMCLRGKNKEI